MKKIVVLLLALVMVLSLAACGEKAPKEIKIGVLVSDVSGEEALAFRAYYEE